MNNAGDNRARCVLKIKEMTSPHEDRVLRRLPEFCGLIVYNWTDLEMIGGNNLPLHNYPGGREAHVFLTMLSPKSADFTGVHADTKRAKKCAELYMRGVSLLVHRSVESKRRARNTETPTAHGRESNQPSVPTPANRTGRVIHSLK